MPRTKRKADAGPCAVSADHGPGYMPRGLCWGCYEDPAVRVLFPPVSRYGRRGSGAGQLRSNGLAAEPCPYPVGSAEQLQVLALRAKAGVELFHPGDNRAVETKAPQFGARVGSDHTGSEASGDRVYKTPGAIRRLLRAREPRFTDDLRTSH